jgi:hypothetical protein
MTPVVTQGARDRVSEILENVGAERADLGHLRPTLEKLVAGVVGTRFFTSESVYFVIASSGNRGIGVPIPTMLIREMPSPPSIPPGVVRSAILKRLPPVGAQIRDDHLRDVAFDAAVLVRMLQPGILDRLKPLSRGLVSGLFLILPDAEQVVIALNPIGSCEIASGWGVT